MRFLLTFLILLSTACGHQSVPTPAPVVGQDMDPVEEPELVSVSVVIFNASESENLLTVSHEGKKLVSKVRMLPEQGAAIEKIKEVQAGSEIVLEIMVLGLELKEDITVIAGGGDTFEIIYTEDGFTGGWL